MAVSVEHLDALVSFEQGGFSAEQLGMLQREIGIATWVWDVTESSARWYGDPSALLGFPQGTFTGRFEQCLERIHPEDRGRARATLIACLKGFEPVYRTEGRVLWPNGSVHWLACYGRGFYGPDGRAQRLAGVIREVSDSERTERLLRIAREKFEVIFAAIPDAIAITRESDATVVEVNDAWVAFTGYSRGAILGRTVLSLGLYEAPEDRDHIVQSLAKGQPVFNFQTRLIRADGKSIDIRLSAMRVEIGGEWFGVWSWSDVTEVRRVEQASAESERRFRTLFMEAPDGIIVLSPEGTILSANPALCRVMGYQAEEVLGEPIARLLGSSGPDRRSTGIAEIISGNLKRADLEAQRKDGGWFSVEVLAERLPDGNVLIFVRDISERKRHEQMLMSLARGVSANVGETFFQSLVSHVGRAIIADYVVIGELIPNLAMVRSLAFWNQGAVAANFEYGLEGTPCADVLKRPGTLMFPQRVTAIFPHDKELRELQVEGYVGTSLFASHGNVLGILVAMSRKPIAHPSQWASVLEIFAVRAAAEIERSRAEGQVRELNVSLERRVAERTRELEAANRELDAFSYSVSHDLRAPLHAITGFAEIVRVAHGATLAGKALHYFERIEHNARQMDNLIGELLEFARAWRVPLTRENVDMGKLVREVLDALPPEDVGRAQLEIAELLPVRGDRALLRQVWSNLIGNALKFSRSAGRPRIAIGGSFREGEAEYFVTDNGAGFDPRYADKLFGVFQRLHSSSEFEGNGVGLALVQRIVARHGGKVAAEGAPRHGATFRFTLPVQSADA